MAGPAAPLARRGSPSGRLRAEYPADDGMGEPVLQPSPSCGCGTSGCSITPLSSSRPSASSKRRRSSAASTRSCCGTPTRSSVSTSATSSTSIATCPASPSWSPRSSHRGVARVHRLQPVGRRHTPRAGERRRRARATGRRPRCRRRVPRHDARGRPRARRGAAPPRPATGARRRVTRAARPHRRPPDELGAMVRRQPGAGGAGGPLVRASPPAAPHPPMEPRPQRRTAVELDERHGHGRLGRRVRLVGRVERARPVDAATDGCAANGRSPTCCVDGEWTPLVDATPAAFAAGVYASRFSSTATSTVWTAVNRGDDDFHGAVLDATRAGGARGSTSRRARAVRIAAMP